MKPKKHKSITDTARQIMSGELLNEGLGDPPPGGGYPYGPVPGHTPTRPSGKPNPAREYFPFNEPRNPRNDDGTPWPKPDGFDENGNPYWNWPTGAGCKSPECRYSCPFPPCGDGQHWPPRWFPPEEIPSDIPIEEPEATYGGGNQSGA